MVFWEELLKILLILFEILNSDDIQDDPSDILQLLLKYLKTVKIGPKN